MAIRHILLVVIALLFMISCDNSSEEKLSAINGYWQISKVENKEGLIKEYSISQNIDFIEIGTNKKGVRKKLEADLFGKFTATKSQENIEAHIEKNTLFLHYSTALDQWQEEVIEANAEKLVIKNKNGLRYTYIRYQPLDLSDD